MLESKKVLAEPSLAVHARITFRPFVLHVGTHADCPSKRTRYTRAADRNALSYKETTQKQKNRPKHGSDASTSTCAQKHSAVQHHVLTPQMIAIKDLLIEHGACPIVQYNTCA